MTQKCLTALSCQANRTSFALTHNYGTFNSLINALKKIILILWPGKLTRNKDENQTVLPLAVHLVVFALEYYEPGITFKGQLQC